ncbi:MAG TPA: hypothetical protein VGZ28_07430, partial [Terriglobales bacterium]|nr:hypothetical protein [Terriglobales bacterium]
MDGLHSPVTETGDTLPGGENEILFTRSSRSHAFRGGSSPLCQRTVGSCRAQGLLLQHLGAAQPWTDTGVDLQAGELLAVTTGASSGANSCDPEGVSGSAEGSTGLPVANAPAGALIARLQAEGMPLQDAGNSPAGVRVALAGAGVADDRVAGMNARLEPELLVPRSGPTTR